MKKILGDFDLPAGDRETQHIPGSYFLPPGDITCMKTDDNCQMNIDNM